jgi:ankyrin repeat protein
MYINIYIVLDRIIITNNFLIYDKVISVLQTKFSPERLRAYLNIPDKEGNTALLYAAYRGNLEIILSLIENGSIVTVTTKKGLNVMHMAAQGDNPDIIIFFKE